MKMWHDMIHKWLEFEFIYSNPLLASNFCTHKNQMLFSTNKIVWILNLGLH